MAAPAAPLALICSHKRTRIANGHARETSAACVDGDFAVTASWDGELRVWRERRDAVARAFCDTAQRVRAYPDAPAAVTAMARVADGYLVSGGIDGTCAVWTRHESREPLHPSHVVAEGDGGGDDGDDGGRSDDANETTSERGRPVSPDPATFVPEPVDDPEEEGIDAETRELRLAARLKWRNEEQFRDRTPASAGGSTRRTRSGFGARLSEAAFSHEKTTTNDMYRRVPSARSSRCTRAATHRSHRMLRPPNRWTSRRMRRKRRGCSPSPRPRTAAGWSPGCSWWTSRTRSGACSTYRTRRA